MLADKIVTRTVGAQDRWPALSRIPSDLVRELAVPHGAAEYKGWQSHPEFGGTMSKRLFVAKLDETWIGEWETGGSQRERVIIKLKEDLTFVMHNVEGKRCTEYRGRVSQDGVLSGTFTQDGRPGGRFKLWPLSQQRPMRRAQKMFIKLASGFCRDVPTVARPELPEECAICLEEFAADDMIATVCGCHSFHHHCIHNWLKENHTCPICRSPIGRPPPNKPKTNWEMYAATAMR